MKILLDTDKKKRRDGQKQLKPFHSQTVPAYGLLPPAGCRTAAQPPDLYQHGQIQKRTNQCEADHWYTNPVRVEAVQSCPDSGANRQRADTDQKAQAAHGSKERTDALQNGEKETRPCNQHSRTG